MTLINLVRSDQTYKRTTRIGYEVILVFRKNLQHSN